jgi:hypothetical protein
MASHAPTRAPSQHLGLYWIGVYLVERVYGGPEDNGWHFQFGELVASPRIYQAIGYWPAAFPTEAEANAYAEKMAPGIDRLNAGRPALDRPTRDSAGRYAVRVFNAPNLPPVFPRNAPRYEQHVKSKAEMHFT